MNATRENHANRCARGSGHLVRLASVLLLLMGAHAHASPMQWKFSDGGNGYYYEHVLVPEGNTWTEAAAASAASSWRGQAGHLVTINSAEEWDFVTQSFPFDWTWIGLSDEQDEGVFRWITGEPVTFTRWIPGEPNDAGGEDYVFYQLSSALGGDWGWNDFRDRKDAWSSTLPIGFVVEYEVIPEPSTLCLAALAGFVAIPVALRRRSKVHGSCRMESKRRQTQASCRETVWLATTS